MSTEDIEILTIVNFVFLVINTMYFIGTGIRQAQQKEAIDIILGQMKTQGELNDEYCKGFRTIGHNMVLIAKKIGINIKEPHNGN